MLLERVSNVMVDHSSLTCLTSMIQRAVTDDPAIGEVLSLPHDIATEKGLRLLFVSFNDSFYIRVYIFFCRESAKPMLIINTR